MRPRLQAWAGVGCNVLLQAVLRCAQVV